MLRIISVSVNGGETPSAREFASLAEIKLFVPAEYRTLSCYWEVFVVSVETGRRVARGYRSGYNGTGNRWAWELL